VRLAPARGSLRHFIGLSQAHLRAKYLGRRFETTALARGWHGNRVGLTSRMLALPRRDHPALRRLEHPESRALQRDAPQATHYWHWPRPSWWQRLRGG
jgi:hypothetical protein